MNFKIKAPNGPHIVRGVSSELTLLEFRKMISNLTNIPSQAQKVKRGYPPVELEASQDSEKLSDLGLTSGETLLVELSAKAAQSHPAVSEPKVSSLSPHEAGILVKRVIESDNSCLFNSVGYVFEKVFKNHATHLRQIIADVVGENPLIYTNSILGMPNHEYQRWILDKKHWGGGIELRILSSHYKTEICALDVKTMRANRFGEDENYPKRVFVIYDGIHYDALAWSPFAGAPESQDITIFPTHDDVIFARAISFISQANMVNNHNFPS
eukprot:Sdes_comp19539_c0_seq3m11145